MPSASVTSVRVNPVAALLAVTVTPGDGGLLRVEHPPVDVARGLLRRRRRAGEGNRADRDHRNDDSFHYV